MTKEISLICKNTTKCNVCRQDVARIYRGFRGGKCPICKVGNVQLCNRKVNVRVEIPPNGTMHQSRIYPSHYCPSCGHDLRNDILKEVNK